MAMRKRTTRPWWKNKQKATVQQVNRKASKRFNWVEMLDSQCTVIQLQPRFCYFNPETSVFHPGSTRTNAGTLDVPSAPPVALNLLPPAATPHDAYDSDDVTLVRIRGYVRLSPIYTLNEATQAAINATVGIGAVDALRVNALRGRNWFLRAGLSKDQWNYIPDPDDPTNPEQGTYDPPIRDPLLTETWTDGKFLRTWDREHFGSMSESHNTFIAPNTFMGCCSDVIGSGGGGGSAINTLTDGTGNIDTEIDDIDISTECVPCLVPAESIATRSGTVLKGDPDLVISLNSRRRLRFSESEGLTLWLNWTSFDEDGEFFSVPQDPGVFAVPAVGWLVRAHVKALIET